MISSIDLEGWIVEWTKGWTEGWVGGFAQTVPSGPSGPQHQYHIRAFVYATESACQMTLKRFAMRKAVSVLNIYGEATRRMRERHDQELIFFKYVN
eukprot:6088868-Amphidinium_carterae.1